MDHTKRDALLKRTGDVNGKVTGLPLVTLEEFFEGNDDAGSIWCNLEAAPEPAEVYKILTEIRKQPGVYDVRILVTQFDGGDEWPFSDTVVFITSHDQEVIRAWLGAAYAPDEITTDMSLPLRAEQIPLPAGMHAVLGWWD
jgi:hypothetical protein